MKNIVRPNNPGKTSRLRVDGVWRGIVEYNVDPLKIGRCKVRVVGVHGTETSITTPNLPWAVPMDTQGFHDGGHLSVPPVGATVWVMFEMGDAHRPIYTGGWLKNPTDEREMLTLTQEKGPVLPERPISMGTWTQPIGPETPREALATPYEPTTHIAHKSIKGNTLLYAERDGFETYRIIDRAGQEFRFFAPVTPEANAGNLQQRGTRSEADGDRFPYADLAGGGSVMEMIGTSGQGIRLLAKDSSEYMEITSTNPALPSTRNSVRALLGGGLGVLEVHGLREGTETCLLSIDLHTGHVELYAAHSITLKTDILNVIASLLSVRADVQIDGDLYVTGNAVFGGEVIGTSNPRKPSLIQDPDIEFPKPVQPKADFSSDDLAGIYLAVPSTVNAGETMNFDLTGYGLRVGDTYSISHADGTPYTGFTVNSHVYHSDTFVTLNISVDGSIPDGTPFSVRVDR